MSPAPRGRSEGGRGIVAVLSRRGRFLVAEPLFAPREERGPGAGGRDGLLTVRRGGRGAAAAEPGDIVLLAASRRGTQATVARVVGRPEVARDVLEALMLDRGLQRRFDDEVEREAGEAAAAVARETGARRDLRGLATFTCDPADARDFDDAISAERLDDGAVRVWVHIADVAAHVHEGSALDREAQRRATSIYVPGAVEPMLPHALSSDACSLRPGIDRAAVTVELDIADGRVRRSAFHRCTIRSDERLDYEQVDDIFAGVQSAEEPWGGTLALAREAAAGLAARRAGRGALVLDSPEPEFSFDARGGVARIAMRAQTESHRMIEQLMIAANEAVAELLSQRGVPCLYRVHERPEPERVKRLLDQLASLEVATPAAPDPMSSTQAAELLGEASQAIERHVARTGRGRLALAALVLRSLKQAYYSPANLGHAGLRSTAYCHFTSPIRRYPDIVCHRALLSTLAGGERAPRAASLTELGVWTSERERDAMRLERDGDDIARCFALERVLRELGPGTVFAGEVTGVIGAGAFVAFALEEPARDEGAPAFEGMLPVRLLRARQERGRGAGRDWWELNEQETILRGERSGAALRLGDPVQVRVERVDAVRGRVDLAPAG